MPPRRIIEIVHGKRAISPDTALRLSRAFGTSDRFWMNLQLAMTWTLSSRRTATSSTRSRLGRVISAAITLLTAYAGTLLQVNTPAPVRSSPENLTPAEFAIGDAGVGGVRRLQLG